MKLLLSFHLYVGVAPGIEHRWIALPSTSIIISYRFSTCSIDSGAKCSSIWSVMKGTSLKNTSQCCRVIPVTGHEVEKDNP